MSSPQPHWERVADDIANRVRKGELRPGDQLPSIGALADHYLVGRSTIKTALLTLRQRGVIRGEPGRGTYIK